MNLMSSDNEKRVYFEDNTIYTVLNMGSYFSNKNCEYNEGVSEWWRLISLDEMAVDGIHIEATVDEKGFYTRIIMLSGKLRRAILLDEDNVTYDVIKDARKTVGDRTLGDIYLPLNNDKNKRNISLTDYLDQEAEFLSLDGKPLEENTLTNDKVKMFFNKSNELLTDKGEIKIKLKKI